MRTFLNPPPPDPILPVAKSHPRRKGSKNGSRDTVVMGQADARPVRPEWAVRVGGEGRGGREGGAAGDMREHEATDGRL